MNDILAILLLLVLLFGCEMKIPYSIDGVPHELVINPDNGEQNK